MEKRNVHPPHSRLLRLGRHISPVTIISPAIARWPTPAAAAAATARDPTVPSTKLLLMEVPGQFIPQRTSDPAEALMLLRRDGGVVFRAVPEGVSLTEREQNRIAAELPARIFGASLAQFKMPARLTGGGWDGRRWQGWVSPPVAWDCVDMFADEIVCDHRKARPRWTEATSRTSRTWTAVR